MQGILCLHWVQEDTEIVSVCKPEYLKFFDRSILTALQQAKKSDNKHVHCKRTYFLFTHSSSNRAASHRVDNVDELALLALSATKQAKTRR